jgi:hypothetical protein
LYYPFFYNLPLPFVCICVESLALFYCEGFLLSCPEEVRVEERRLTNLPTYSTSVENYLKLFKIKGPLNGFYTKNKKIKMKGLQFNSLFPG